MDALDRKLIVLLEHDPRITYREIGDELRVSVPTAQRRVENLFTSGRIRSVRYRLEAEALGGEFAIFHGEARVNLTPEVILGLQDHGSIHRVLFALNNYMGFWVDIREEGDIEGVLNFLRSRLDLASPKYHLVPNKSSSGGLIDHRKEENKIAKPGHFKMLTNTDLRIVRQLSLDGRKPISSIAQETGLSSRTVKRRIDSMLKNNLIQPEVDWYMGKDDDIWFTMFVRLSDPSAKNEFFDQLVKLEGKNVQLFTCGWYYPNTPDMVTFDGMIQSLSELHNVVSTVSKISGVVEVNPNVVHMSYLFDTWVNRMSRGELPLPHSSTK
jgi:DNA-binding Lrp family transcriptional regulator